MTTRQFYRQFWSFWVLWQFVITYKTSVFLLTSTPSVLSRSWMTHSKRGGHLMSKKFKSLKKVHFKNRYESLCLVYPLSLPLLWYRAVLAWDLSFECTPTLRQHVPLRSDTGFLAIFPPTPRGVVGRFRTISPEEWPKLFGLFLSRSMFYRSGHVGLPASFPLMDFIADKWWDNQLNPSPIAPVITYLDVTILSLLLPQKWS